MQNINSNAQANSGEKAQIEGVCMSVKEYVGWINDVDRINDVDSINIGSMITKLTRFLIFHQLNHQFYPSILVLYP